MRTEFFLNKPKICRVVTRIFAIAKLFSFSIKKFLEKNQFFFIQAYKFKLKTNSRIKNFIFTLLMFKKTYYSQIKKLMGTLKMENKIKSYKYTLGKILNINNFF